MHDVPPLSSWAREVLDEERGLPTVAANRRDRAVARARAAVRAGEAPVALRSSVAASRIRWAVAAVLACTAAAASATILEWRGRTFSRGESPTPAAAQRVSMAQPPVAVAAEVPGGPSAAPVGEGPREPSVHRGVEPAATATRSTPRSALSDELRLLAPARAALARRDFAGALVAIGDHARRFRDGRLVEEREALRVKALAGLGRAQEARAVAADFRRRFPRSALLPAIAGSLDGE